MPCMRHHKCQEYLYWQKLCSAPQFSTSSEVPKGQQKAGLPKGQQKAGLKCPSISAHVYLTADLAYREWHEFYA